MRAGVSPARVRRGMIDRTWHLREESALTRKKARLATVGVVGCTLLAIAVGCDGTTQTKPTIDTSTPIKAPVAPTTQKVERQAAGQVTIPGPPSRPAPGDGPYTSP